MMHYNYSFTLIRIYQRAIIILIWLLCGCYFSQAQPLNVNVTTTPSCNHDGTATANVTGGVPPYSFEWFAFFGSVPINQFTQTAINLSPTITPGSSSFGYQVVVTDAVGNTFYAEESVSSPIDFFTTITHDVCHAGVGSINLSSLSGMSPFTFLWSNGQTTQNASSLIAGNYEVTVTDANGCTVMASELIDTTSQGQPLVIRDYPPFTVTMNTTIASCINGTATANVIGGTPPYNYSWNTTPIQLTQMATGLSGFRLYQVTITDNAGCTGKYYASTGITMNNLNVGVNVIPDTCGRGLASLTAYGIGGVPPYSYLWSNNQTTAILDSLNSALYKVTITDNAGCTRSIQKGVPNYSPVHSTYSTIAATCTFPTGSITVYPTGGTLPYNYYWQTNPIQLTQTADSLIPGNYNVVVTDSNGCTSENSIPVNDSFSFSLIVSSSPDVCHQHFGSAAALPANGQAPYSYLWSNGATIANNTNLSYNYYTVTVTDAANCVRSKKVFVGDDNLLSMGFSVTNTSCILTNDGSITVNVAGGTPPYSYLWNNTSITSTTTGLLTGYHGVTVTDAIGCVKSGYTFVDYDSILPCANIIEGFIYNDVNMDCIHDPGEKGIANAYIKCSGYKFSDPSGYYRFVVPNGTYTTEQVYPPYWYNLNCPLTPYQNIVTAGQIITNNFENVGNANDFKLDNYVSTPARPGFSFSHFVRVTNQGTTTNSNILLKVKHDSLTSFISSNPPASNYSLADRTITFNLVPFFYNYAIYKDVEITYNLPANIPIGTQLSFVDTVFPFAGDTLIYNNYANQIIPVVGSYDPNSIEVTPQGSTAAGYISTADSELTYLIRFQNTGNYPAQNVMIKTQIDNDLDLRTFKKGAGTFPFDVEISSTGIATFTMQNIFLPDSISNEPASHGFVAFKIRQKPNLIDGTPITTNAAIYFDFNAPVITNNVINTITGLQTVSGSTVFLLIAPNPSKDYCTITSPSFTTSTLTLYDITGRALLQQPFNSTAELNLSVFAPGIYIVEIKDKQGHSAKAKVVKE